MEDKIVAVAAQQLIDCKCRPVVEVVIDTASGGSGRGSAPTGSSVGMHEAFILRDGDPANYDGLSVHKAVEIARHVIGPALLGMNVFDQRAIDTKMIELDGTPNKRALGGNTIYSASIAALRAAADSVRTPVYKYMAGGDITTVPVPCFNVVNGGHYGNFTQSFNEFLLVPHGADTIDEAVRIGVSVFRKLAEVLEEHLGESPRVASSYGYAAPSDDPELVLALMERAVDLCGHRDKVAFALDCASSGMHDRESATYPLKGRRVCGDELIAYAAMLTGKWPIVFIEDLLDENDWEGHRKAVEALDRTIVVGDDLTVTNVEFLRKAHALNAIEGFVLKPNQVGTISEALDAWRFAREHGMIAVPSGRSGGVVDDVVMDLSVGLQVPLQKNGAPRSGERIEKLNFLMRASASSPGCTLHDISGLLKF